MHAPAARWRTGSSPGPGQRWRAPALCSTGLSAMPPGCRSRCPCTRHIAPTGQADGTGKVRKRSALLTPANKHSF